MAAAKFDRALLDSEAKKSAADYLSWRSGDPAKRLQELAKAFLGERLQQRAIIDRLERTVAALEARVAAAEDASTRTFADCYAGSWQRPAKYARGQIVTSDGSLWLALSASYGKKPGTDSAWRLIVKRGESAREAE